MKNKIGIKPTYNTMESKEETTLFTIKSNLLKNCKNANVNKKKRIWKFQDWKYSSPWIFFTILHMHFAFALK